MAGMGSQASYEADLLQTYLRRGRVSPIQKRDVNLALSIYKLPGGKTPYDKQKKLTYNLAKRYSRGKSDQQVFHLATAAVLNKSTADRKAAAKAAKAEKAMKAHRPAPAPSAPRGPAATANRPPAPRSVAAPRPAAPRIAAPRIAAPRTAYRAPTMIDSRIGSRTALRSAPRTETTRRPRRTSVFR